MSLLTRYNACVESALKRGTTSQLSWSSFSLLSANGVSIPPEYQLPQQGIVVSQETILPKMTVAGGTEKVTITIGRLKTTLSVEVYQSLSSYSYEEVYATILNYYNLGLNTINFSSVGSDIYKYIESISKIPTVECFASIFDRSLDTWCSLFSDPGSKGDFFTYIRGLNIPSLLLLHPPDITPLVDAAVEETIAYLNRVPGSGAIFFLEHSNASLGAVAPPVSVSGYEIYTIGSVPDISSVIGTATMGTVSDNTAIVGTTSDDTATYHGTSLLTLLTSPATSKRTLTEISRLTKLRPNDISQAIVGIGGDAPEDAYYSSLRTLVQSKRGAGGKSGWSNIQGDVSRRASNRVNDILSYVKDIIVMDGGYLDIGAADGSITKAIGDSIKATVIYGNDKVNTLNPVYGITFVESLDDIPSGTLKLVTAMMTLHHIPSISHLLEQVERVLLPGGMFIIREHAFQGSNSEGLIMVEHIVYDYVLGDYDYSTTLESNRLYPRSRDTMTRLITSVGLELVGSVDIKYGLYVYYAYFRKPIV